jgi:hypothetical protein
MDLEAIIKSTPPGFAVWISPRSGFYYSLGPGESGAVIVNATEKQLLDFLGSLWKRALNVWDFYPRIWHFPFLDFKREQFMLVSSNPDRPREIRIFLTDQAYEDAKAVALASGEARRNGWDLLVRKDLNGTVLYKAEKV